LLDIVYVWRQQLLWKDNSSSISSKRTAVGIDNNSKWTAEDRR